MGRICQTLSSSSSDPYYCNLWINNLRKFLKPKDTYRLIQKILVELNTENKRKKFSEYLGSLSGDYIFRYISRDNKDIGKKYSELLIQWYKEYWNDEWAIPKFFHSVAHEYPELKSQIDKEWGGVGTE